MNITNIMEIIKLGELIKGVVNEVIEDKERKELVEDYISQLENVTNALIQENTRLRRSAAQGKNK